MNRTRRRTYTRDARGRFTSTGGTRRGRAVAGLRRAGARRGWSGGLEVDNHGHPRATVRKDAYRSDRITLGGSLSVQRSPRITLTGGVHGSLHL